MTQPAGPAGPTLENRLPAEGINSSDEHPLREFAWLVAAALVTLALTVLLVGWAARWLAPQLPFAVEVGLAERIVDKAATPQSAPRSAALQALAHRVAAQMQLPPGMSLRVTWEAAPLVNAYATVGGRIRVYQGLLDKLQSEEALTALLAHEIAHTKHRHVAANVGRGLALAMLLGVVSSDAGAAAAETLLSSATGLALLSYSREQERQADDEALAASVALYGHGGGMVELFTQLRPAAAAEDPSMALLRTHPMTQERIEAVQSSARNAGWSLAGDRTPLPETLRRPAGP